MLAGLKCRETALTWALKNKHKHNNDNVYNNMDFKYYKNRKKCICFSFCLKATTELDITIQSGREFHTLTMRLTKEWPSRTEETCDLSNFLELPLVLLIDEKVCSLLFWYLVSFLSKINMYVCMLLYSPVVGKVSRISCVESWNIGGIECDSFGVCVCVCTWSGRCIVGYGKLCVYTMGQKNVADWQSIFVCKSGQILTDFCKFCICFNHRLKTVAIAMHCNLRPPDIASVVQGFRSTRAKQNIYTLSSGGLISK